MKKDTTQHQLDDKHPDFCSPAVIYIEDRDCLMEDENNIYIKWTPNIAFEKVIPMLKRTVNRMEKEVEHRKSHELEHQQGHDHDHKHHKDHEHPHPHPKQDQDKT